MGVNERKLAGQDRINFTGISSTSSPLGGTGRRGDQPNIDAGDSFVKTSGDTMLGALAFHPNSVTIATGAIDISKETTDKFTSYAIVTGEGAVDDTLATITGAFHAGQILYLQPILTNEITLTETGGNLILPGGTDLALNTAKDGRTIAKLIFDVTVNSNKWTLVSNSDVATAIGLDLTTKGDVHTFSTVDIRLGVGANDEVLTADSAEVTGLKWASGVGSGLDLTTKGDIHGFTTVDARLPVGTNGQILTADSGEALGIKWDTNIAGANITLSNLSAGLVVINTSLKSDTDGIDDLGSFSFGWDHVFCRAVIFESIDKPVDATETSIGADKGLYLWFNQTEVADTFSFRWDDTGVFSLERSGILRITGATGTANLLLVGTTQTHGILNSGNTMEFDNNGTLASKVFQFGDTATEEGERIFLTGTGNLNTEFRFRTDQNTVSTQVARIVFEGHDAGGADTEYGQITVDVADPTAGVEDGAMFLRVAEAGTENVAYLDFNAAASTQIRAKKDFNMNGNLLLNCNIMQSDDASVADNGTIRLGNAQSIQFRNSANTGNATFTFDSFDDWVFQFGNLTGDANWLVTAIDNVIFRLRSDNDTAGEATGFFIFEGENDSASTNHEYGRIVNIIRDPAAGAEDGSLQFGVHEAGSNVAYLELRGDLANIQISKPVDMNSNNITELPGTFVSALSTVTGVTGDFVMIVDATDSALKKVNLSDLLGGGVQTPWASDIVAAGFDLNDISNLEFRVTVSKPAASISAVYNEAGGLRLNAGVAENIEFSINDALDMIINAGNVDFRSNDLINVGSKIESGSDAVVEIAMGTAGITYAANTGDVHTWTVAGGNNMSFNGSIFDINGSKMEGLATLEGSADVNVEIIFSTAGITYAANTGDIHTFIVASGSDTTFNGAQWDFNGSVLTDIGDVRIQGANRLRAFGSVEIGISVTNDSISVGTEGTLQPPVLSGSSGTKAAADTDFGNVDGCMGIININTNTPSIIIRCNSGQWSAIGLTLVFP